MMMQQLWDVLSSSFCFYTDSGVKWWGSSYKMFYYALVQKLKLECGIWQRELQFDTLYHTKKKKKPLFNLCLSLCWTLPHQPSLVDAPLQTYGFNVQHLNAAPEPLHCFSGCPMRAWRNRAAFWLFLSCTFFIAKFLAENVALQYERVQHIPTSPKVFFSATSSQVCSNLEL